MRWRGWRCWWRWGPAPAPASPGSWCSPSPPSSAWGCAASARAAPRHCSPPPGPGVLAQTPWRRVMSGGGKWGDQAPDGSQSQLSDLTPVTAALRCLTQSWQFHFSNFAQSKGRAKISWKTVSLSESRSVFQYQKVLLKDCHESPESGYRDSLSLDLWHTAPRCSPLSSAHYCPMLVSASPFHWDQGLWFSFIQPIKYHEPDLAARVEVWCDVTMTAWSCHMTVMSCHDTADGTWGMRWSSPCLQLYIHANQCQSSVSCFSDQHRQDRERAMGKIAKCSWNLKQKKLNNLIYSEFEAR